MTTKSADDVHRFWFTEHGPADWFAANPEFDAAIAEQFSATHEEVSRGEGWTWRATPLGRVAEVVVLDQFSRQLHRGSARAFAQDAMALTLAQEAVALAIDKLLTHPPQRMFLYMPYMHSESLAVHEEAVRLFTALGDEGTLKFELAHVDVLKRFGRFPRRNAAFGRVSTPEEIEYMASGTGMF
jgi:uncharacterized protein (DUF924 family)